MPDDERSYVDSTTAFDHDIRVVAGFVIGFAALAVVANTVQSWLLAPDSSRVVKHLFEAPIFLILGVMSILALRAEGVELREIGVSGRLARIALATVAAVVVVINVVVVVVAIRSGNELSLGLYGQYVRVFDAGTASLVVGALSNYLIVGPIEELGFRGYLQNKVIALVGNRETRLRTAIGIGTAAVVFALAHLPDLLLDDGVGVGELVGGLLLLTMSGILFGAIYELTQNLVLVALLHGIGNFWPLAVDPGPGIWPNYGVILLVYAIVIYAYRKTALPKGRSQSEVSVWA